MRKYIYYYKTYNRTSYVLYKAYNIFEIYNIAYKSSSTSEGKMCHPKSKDKGRLELLKRQAGSSIS